MTDTAQWQPTNLCPVRDNSDIFLIRNEATGLLYLRKNPTHGDLQVYHAIAQNPHPNLVAVHHATFAADGRIEVYEQYVNAPTLESYLAQRGRLQEGEVRHIAQNLTLALQHLHSLPRPIIHRDIKLSNVLRCEDGRILLCDYDAARLYEPQGNKDTVPLGTHGYAAPEQFGFSQSDARTDIYSLGVLLNKLLTGEAPQTGMATGHWGEVIRRCTAFSPQDRYANVSQLRQALGFEAMPHYSQPLQAPYGQPAAGYLPQYHYPGAPGRRTGWQTFKRAFQSKPGKAFTGVVLVVYGALLIAAVGILVFIIYWLIQLGSSFLSSLFPG